MSRCYETEMTHPIFDRRSNSSELQNLGGADWSLDSRNFLSRAEEAKSEDNRNLKYVQILNFPRENGIMSY